MVSFLTLFLFIFLKIILGLFQRRWSQGLFFWDLFWDLFWQFFRLFFLQFFWLPFWLFFWPLFWSKFVFLIWEKQLIKEFFKEHHYFSFFFGLFGRRSILLLDFFRWLKNLCLKLLFNLWILFFYLYLFNLLLFTLLFHFREIRFLYYVFDVGNCLFFNFNFFCIIILQLLLAVFLFSLRSMQYRPWDKGLNATHRFLSRIK